MTSTNLLGQPGILGRRTVAAFGAAALGLVAAGSLAMASTSPAEAAAPPEVFSGFRNAAILSGSTPYATQLNVPAGSYVLFAKASAFNALSSTSASHNVFCELRAGTDFDRSFTRIAPNAEQTVSNNVVHTFAGAGTVTLSCNDTVNATGSTLLEFIKLTAVRVNSPISNIPLP
ncbi:MAG TPA: hypothetical protein VF657_14470 [Actinoplanes sp.]